MKFGNWSDAPCYYVTCKDAGRTGWLSGPYQTPEDALGRCSTSVCTCRAT